MTKAEAQDSLAEAIALILADRREDGLRGVPPEALRETVVVARSRVPYCATFVAMAALSSAKDALIHCGGTRRPARWRLLYPVHPVYPCRYLTYHSPLATSSAATAARSGKAT